MSFLPCTHLLVTPDFDLLQALRPAWAGLSFTLMALPLVLLAPHAFGAAPGGGLPALFELMFGEQAECVYAAAGEQMRGWAGLDTDKVNYHCLRHTARLLHAEAGREAESMQASSGMNSLSKARGYLKRMRQAADLAAKRGKPGEHVPYKRKPGKAQPGEDEAGAVRRDGGKGGEVAGRYASRNVRLGDQAFQPATRCLLNRRLIFPGKSGKGQTIDVKLTRNHGVGVGVTGTATVIIR